jgi:cytochrome b
VAEASAATRLRVWDLPTRLFHWLLAAGVSAAVVTGKLGGNLIEWHGRIGLLILGLLTFRVVWGFIGSPTARFANFVRGPAAIRAYLRGEWRGVGHNPLGALSVLALLALTLAQVGSGLFANDDIAFEGPLAGLVGKDWSNRASGVHEWLLYGLLGLIGLHVAAVGYYVRVRKDNLVRPMVTGWREIAATAREPAAKSPAHPGGSPLRFALAAAIAFSAVYAAAGHLLPTPPPAPPQAQHPSPSW